MVQSSLAPCRGSLSSCRAAVSSATERQIKTAVRVAKVLREEFEPIVE
jgi:hypothetical protein